MDQSLSNTFHVWVLQSKHLLVEKSGVLCALIQGLLMVRITHGTMTLSRDSTASDNLGCEFNGNFLCMGDGCNGWQTGLGTDRQMT